MKKEFGKWFLDLAKYILTGIFLSTYLTGIEGTALVWGSIIGFFFTLFIGYFLLKASDEESKTTSPLTKESCHEVKEKKKKQSKKARK